MTVEEAGRVVAILNAAFPNEAVEAETFRLWMERLVPLQHYEQAFAAANVIASNGRRFPLLVEFREAYRQQVERMPRPLEIEKVASGPRDLPDSVREWMDAQGLRTP